MANNFEYKIHVSIDRNSVKDDVKQALANMAKEVKNNAFQIELTGDPKNLIQQLVNLKKQVPTLDLSKGLQFNLADAIADDTEQGKKIINEFATYIINSVSEAVTSIDALSDSIKNTESALEGLKARRKNLLKDDGSADVVTAFEKAQERLEKASNKFADSKQNKGKLDAAEEMKQAYQDIINYQSEAGKEMSDKTKQILGVFAKDTAKVFKNANGEITNLAEHLKDVKVNSSYKEDLRAIESQIFENENKLTQLRKNLESAQNPELQVKGKLADNFLGDLQSQLDQMTGLEVKVKPKVDKDVKLEVEVEEDIKPIDSPNNSNNSSEIEEKKQEIKEISHDLEDVQQHINNIKPQKTQDEIRVEFEKTRNTVDQTVSSQGSYFESLFEKAKTTKLSYEEVIAVVSEAEKISSQFTKHNLELQDTDFAWADGDWEKYDIGFQGTKSDMDNFKQSLSDTYKLYKNVESAIKNNAGMYKGQFYDNSNLDNLRGIFQNIASYADELGIDINSVIESIPRMTKEFKGLAVDAVLQQKNITENNRQYDGESEELKNINSQLQERYRLLKKILTITTKDNIGKTVDIEHALSSGALSDFTDKDFQYGNVQTVVENICKLLGIEIPSAAEKAKEAINEATSTPPNTSAMDAVEEELHEEAQAANEAAEAERNVGKAREEANYTSNENGLLSDTEDLTNVQNKIDVIRKAFDSMDTRQTTSEGLFNWIKENCSEIEQALFNTSEGIEEFKKVIRGLAFNSNNKINISETLGLDIINFNELSTKEKELESFTNSIEGVMGSEWFAKGEKTDLGQLYSKLFNDVKTGAKDAQSALAEFNAEKDKLQSDKNNLSSEVTITTQLEKETEIKRDDTAATNELIEAEKKLHEEASKPILTNTNAKSSEGIDNRQYSSSDNFKSAIDEHVDNIVKIESQAEKTAIEANSKLSSIKNEANEANDVVDELSRDIDNLGNTPNPTDNAFENTIISYKKALDKLSDTLPSDYSGEVRNQLNSLYDELNVMTEDDDLTEWGSKYRVVADNVRLVNDEVKNLGKNLTMSKADYSLSLDKSLKINELNKYRDELRELGLESDDVKSRITELYNRLGSAQDKSDLGIFSKEFKLLQQEMSDVVKGKRKDNQDASNNDIKSRNILLSNYISKLKEQAKYEEQIKALRAKGVDDSDNQITSRTKAIEEINNEITLMGKLNLTEEENLNIQTQVNEARRKYAVNIKEANDKKDSASGQQSLNATKQEYIKLLKEENDLLMKNYQLEKAGEAAGKEYSDNETEIQKIQKTKEATADLLRTKGQEEFVTTEIARANKELYEKQTAYNKKLKNEEDALQKRRLNLLQQITQWLNANPIADKKYGSLLADGIKTLNSSAEVTPEILKQIETEFKNVKLEATKAGETGAGFFQILKQRWQSLGAYLASFASFYRVAAYVRQAITSVRELDDALTEMRKVSDESVSTLKAFQQESFNIADQVGSTAKVIQDSTADWMRLGESLNEAKESAKDASILLNVSEFQSIDEATTALVAMSQAYKEMDKIDIIDKLNNIGNNFSISTDQLATGLQNAAAVLKTQGNDIDKSIALLTAANSIVQDISKASTGIRTIALRIAGTETAKKELEELGESVDDYIVQTQSKTQETIKAYTAVASNAGRGIDVLDANGNLRDTYDILLDISKIYKEIQEEDKKAGTNRAKALVEYIAGKNRSNIAASVLENPELLEEVYKASQDSAGSALEENEKYLDSISGHIAKLQNQLQKLYTDTIDSGFVKWTLDLLTNVTKLVDKVGLLRSAIIGIVTVIGSKKLGYCN